MVDALKILKVGVAYLGYPGKPPLKYTEKQEIFQLSFFPVSFDFFETTFDLIFFVSTDTRIVARLIYFIHSLIFIYTCLYSKAAVYSIYKIHDFVSSFGCNISYFKFIFVFVTEYAFMETPSTYILAYRRYCESKFYFVLNNKELLQNGFRDMMYYIYFLHIRFWEWDH